MKIKSVIFYVILFIVSNIFAGCKDTTPKSEVMYLVTFQTFGNDNVKIPEPIMVKEGSLIVAPQNIKIDISVVSERVFKGWYKDSNFKNKWNFDTDRVVENTTLYARWDKSPVYKVTYTDINLIINVSFGNLADEPSNPTKPGYEFINWYKDPEFKELWDFSKEIIVKDTYIYSKWKQLFFTISFEENGGSEVKPLTNVPGGTLTNTVTTPVPLKQDYIFLGWYNDVDLMNPWSNSYDIVASDITLYAKWVLDTCTLSFESNGGTNVENIENIIKGTTVTEPKKPTREGYTFLGWYRDEGLSYIWNFATDKITENTKLYAKWSPNIYTVTFNSNGGTLIKPISGIPHNSKLTDLAVPLPAAPAKEGHTFGGWYKEENLTTMWNFAIDKVTSDITLHAKWNINQYTVTFVSDGGTAVESKTVNFDELLTAPVEPDKTGNMFFGWYKDIYLTSQWNFSTEKVKENLTLYAKWKVFKPAEYAYVEKGVAGPLYDGTSISISKSFYIGKFEVTQAQWKEVMKGNKNDISDMPSYFKGEEVYNNPVEMVSWYDVVVFCNRLSVREGLNPVYSLNGSTDVGTWGKVPTSKIESNWENIIISPSANGYRCPSVIEWDFAAVGGVKFIKHWNFSGSDILGEVGWYDSNSFPTNAVNGISLNGKLHGTMPVGLKNPNELETYDMSGNVSEFIEDVFIEKSSNGDINCKYLKGGYWGWNSSPCYVGLLLKDNSHAVAIPLSVKKQGYGLRVIRYE